VSDSTSEPAVTGWFARLRAAFNPPARTTGRPASRTGASSFHLWWDVPYGDRLVEAAVTMEVVDPPAEPGLVFWALQVSFVKPGGGGAHLGLQWNPRHPGGTAVNWGGYAPEGGLLEGSPSPLPSTPDDPNTRDLLWFPRRPYRLRIARADGEGPGGTFRWRGSITDLEAGETFVVRDLFSPGEFLRGPVMWTESFQDCDAPSFAVRWSAPEVVVDDGRRLAIGVMHADYQRHAAGGCDNTDSSVDAAGWLQRTNTPRIHPPGSRLALPRPA